VTEVAQTWPAGPRRRPPRTAVWQPGCRTAPTPGAPAPPAPAPAPPAPPLTPRDPSWAQPCQRHSGQRTRPGVIAPGAAPARQAPAQPRAPGRPRRRRTPGSLARLCEPASAQLTALVRTPASIQATGRSSHKCPTTFPQVSGLFRTAPGGPGRCARQPRYQRERGRGRGGGHPPARRALRAVPVPVRTGPGSGDFRRVPEVLRAGLPDTPLTCAFARPFSRFDRPRRKSSGRVVTARSGGARIRPPTSANAAPGSTCETARLPAGTPGRARMPADLGEWNCVRDSPDTWANAVIPGNSPGFGVAPPAWPRIGPCPSPLLQLPMGPPAAARQSPCSR
jgi:hypothetical protein